MADDADDPVGLEDDEEEEIDEESPSKRARTECVMRASYAGASKPLPPPLGLGMTRVLCGRRGSEFPKGTIKKVRVSDFMVNLNPAPAAWMGMIPTDPCVCMVQTYAGEVTIRPGARLNLILGPNGG